jgi:glycerophosphoryl diester phosphodiesterase
LPDVLTWISKRLAAAGFATNGATATSIATATNGATATNAVATWPGATGKLRAALDRGNVTPLTIAHAGGDLEAPHSTPFAFSRAVQLGVDVLEMDVRLSSDGVLVVHHDPTVDRTTNETGAVATRTAQQLAALDNGYWFQPGCWDCRSSSGPHSYRGVRTGSVPPPAGADAEDFRITTLDDILTRFPDTVLDIEIKADGPGGGAPVAEALAKRLRADDVPDRFVVVSFDDATIDAFREIAPEIATSPGLGALSRYVLAGVKPINTPLIQVPPELQGLPIFTEALQATAARDGIAIWVWPSDSTTDTAATYKKLLDAKPNGIIAGRPSALLDLLR